jgi:hypothetical protein
MLASGLHAGIADPVEKAFAFLEHLEKCSSELWSGGCLLGSFSMELADTNSRVQHRCGRVPGASGDFAEKLQPIADQCAGKQAPQASVFADTLLSIVESSIILAKAHRDRPASLRPSADFDSHWRPNRIFKGTPTRIQSVESGRQK